MALAGLAGLIVAAFLAATILPLQSEAVFVALQLAGTVPVWLMILAAGAANTAGSALTWAMGRGIIQMRQPPREGRAAAAHARAEAVFQRWGKWSLLVSWAPLGDLLCLIAGAMRMPFGQFLLIVGFAKTARYAALAAATSGALAWLWT